MLPRILQEWCVLTVWTDLHVDTGRHNAWLWSWVDMCAMKYSSRNVPQTKAKGLMLDSKARITCTLWEVNCHHVPGKGECRNSTPTYSAMHGSSDKRNLL